MQVPEDLLESARMDNAGEFKTLFKIVLPMTKGSVIMAELFSFISTWNSYFWPLVMTNDRQSTSYDFGNATSARCKPGTSMACADGCKYTFGFTDFYNIYRFKQTNYVFIWL